MLFSCNVISFASEQKTDIARTRLGTSNTYYEFNSSSKTLTISGTGETPNYINDSVSQPWYKWRSNGSVENVVVEEGITGLGDYFLYCVCAKNISLPSSLIRISSFALSGNNMAEKITLSENITTISNNAFYSCIKLKSVNIPASVNYIGVSAFEKCLSLSSIKFESMNMNVIVNNRAFLACDELKVIDLPKNITFSDMGNFTLGFSSADQNSKNDISIGVYRDSPAYTYVKINGFAYRLLDSMEIFEGNTISREYFNSGSDRNIDDNMKFYFTPSDTSYYTFSSSGDVDVDCTLTDAHGNIIKKCLDISEDDLNFSVSNELAAGERYCFIVSSNNSAGVFSVSLGTELESIRVDWNFNLSADAVKEGRLDIASIINNETIDFIYKSGYVESVPFSENKVYAGYKMSYQSRLDSIVTCGENTDYITVGDKEFAFTISIEHSYVVNVFEPTFNEGGYTTHTCVLCAVEYTSDFKDCLSSDFYGRVVILDKIGGKGFSSKPVPDVTIYDCNGRAAATTDENGYFYVTSYQTIRIENFAGPDRIVEVQKGNHNLGDVPLISCDFNEDNYINAKDYALFRTIYGYYGDSDEEDYRGFNIYDINNDEIIDDEDWKYAMNFAAYGKIDERIYDTVK
ncbi:MAG: leucine-rich repeat domain-containing protein [Acetobacter sp.]|nr:leucine-rich repeat domain-containing protein [Bacteroides sp.]MCM1340281.1 leucine-rich repeat domain-containing protein [Acetobacter sp.]MCM1432769.1 leucine-rich repeat domain-containing protein [Clostridiales bacterium]